MDRQKLSAIAHLNHPIAAPLHGRQVDALIDQVAVSGDGLVLDIGCGRGEWLVRIVERSEVRGVGIDVSPRSLRAARETAERRGVSNRCTFRVKDAKSLVGDGQQYDLVLCIGSTHALGGLSEAIAAIYPMVRPGGHAVVGEGFWERAPDERTLQIFEATPDEYAELAHTVDAMAAPGFTPMYAHVSTQSEWDDYEWSWTGSIERYVQGHPDDPDADEMREEAARHRQDYLHGYRGVLGFVTCVLGNYG